MKEDALLKEAARLSRALERARSAQALGAAPASAATVDEATVSTPPVSARVRFSESDRKRFSDATPATPSAPKSIDEAVSGEARAESSTQEVAAAKAPEEGDEVVVLRLEAAASALFDRSAAEWVRRPDSDGSGGGSSGGARVTFQHPPTAAVPRDVARFCVPPRLRHSSPSVHYFSFTDASGVRTFAASLACIQSEAVEIRSGAPELQSGALEILVVLCAWPVGRAGFESAGAGGI